MAASKPAQSGTPQRRSRAAAACVLAVALLTPAGAAALSFSASWTGAGSLAGRLRSPQGVAADGRGAVYVTDRVANRVVKFTSRGKYIGAWGSTGSGPGQFDQAEGITTDVDGNVYVVDRGNARVEKFAYDGRFLTQWGTAGTGTGQFSSPIGIGSDLGGPIYVADTGNSRIQKFEPDGTFVSAFGDAKGPGHLDFPAGVSVDRAGHVWVADNGNDRVVEFTETGSFLRAWGRYGSGRGRLANPVAVAVGADGYVYVADQDNNRVQAFTPSGRLVGQTRRIGRAATRIGTPRELSTDCSGNVFVVDGAHKRIARFRNRVTSAGRSHLVFSRAIRAAHKILLDVATPRRLVALSFDDGPDPRYTPSVLAQLAHYGDHATFFMIGREAQRYPSLVRRVVAAGDEAGDHTYSHPNLAKLGSRSIADELARGSLAIQAAGAPRPTLMRPPFGAFSARVGAVSFKQGLLPVRWNLGLDAETHHVELSGETADRIIARQLHSARPGSIILAHDGGENRDAALQALPGLLAGLHRACYKVVTISSLLRQTGFGRVTGG